MKKLLFTLIVVSITGCQALAGLSGWGLDVKTPFVSIGIATVDSD